MKSNTVFSLVNDMKPVMGCTISERLLNDVTCFSLAEETDISAERYPLDVLHWTLSGTTILNDRNDKAWKKTLHAEDVIVRPSDHDIGTDAVNDSVYLEITLGKEYEMNKAIKAGEVFRLNDLVPYQDGRIVNMDIASNDHMKFVVMSFDAGTGLSEHAAPGEAIVFALDGNGIIGYEGKEYPIAKGEQFHFAKGGMHYVKANEKFSMALLLTLD